MHTTHKLLLAACALALAACSDNPSSEPPPVADTQVPASAGASTAAFVSYAQGMPTSDRAAPLGLDLVTPPTSETEAPKPL